MAKWKLCRQTYTNETYEFMEGDTVTIGRGTQNTIILSSLNISRKHCVITAKKDEVIIEDLKSANGIFVGLKKISPNIPFSLSNNDIIGLGWTDGAPLAKVDDAEQFVFKLIKISNDSSIINRIQFQNEHEALAQPDEIITDSINLSLSKVFEPTSKFSLKRKSNIRTESDEQSSTSDTNTINVHDSIVDNSNENSSKKFKYNINCGETENKVVKNENDEQYEAFNIKQECFDDEVQLIDSDSDSEQWYFRLSQNSPRKSFTTFNENKKSEDCQQDCSYSQLDDDVVFVKTEVKTKNESDYEQYENDLISILPPSVDIFDSTSNNKFSVKSDDINKNSNSVLTSDLTSISISELIENTKNKADDNVLPVSPPLNIYDDLPAKEIKDTEDSRSEITEDSRSEITEESRSEINIRIIKKSFNDLISIETDKHFTKESYNFSTETTIQRRSNENSRNIQLIDYKSNSTKKSTHNIKGKIKRNNSSKSKSSSKIHITNSQKEERKKKLREIAIKGKEDCDRSSRSNARNEENNTTTPKVSAKITTSNRGAFLIDPKPLKCKSKHKIYKDKNDTTRDKLLVDRNDCGKGQKKINSPKSSVNIETRTSRTKEHPNKSENKKNKKYKSIHNKHRTLSVDSTSPRSPYPSTTALRRRSSDNIHKKGNKTKDEEENKHIVCYNETEKSNNTILQVRGTDTTSLEKSGVNFTISLDGKASSQQTGTSDEIKLQYKVQTPIPKIDPVSIKTILKPMEENKEPNKRSQKKVRFSEVQPQIVEFEIEQGNKMKKTSTAKQSLLDARTNIPAFSLQKIALMRILRWNPRWLEEQNNFSEPPPILGHNNVPMAILHSFTSHTQYVELIGDLLLMEIWECLTQGYVKTRNENNFLQMRIEALPLIPPQRNGLELTNLSVNVSLPTAQTHNVLPREGEVMMFHFGEDTKICRFFFVLNIRCLPSPPNNINSFYSISLQTSFTEKMRTLQRGALLYGKRLAYINKDLRLFEAMEYLSKSPLHEVILNPQPRHFALDEAERTFNIASQWGTSLNDSQRKAVVCAVSAAQRERPRIHMIQGPPGTGKSRVICAIVMEYFYDAAGKKQRNRGKILLCAPSNAAVDELVIRLLDIRQSLPKPERLKLVRVGREEAMHPRASPISSINLAHRDASRFQPDSALNTAAVTAEISLLEAKKNMWQTKAMSAGDDARVAFCHNRVAEISKKIAMFRNCGGGTGGATCGPELVAQAERRVLEGADVVLTTLASAHSHKMRGLAGRIALCIVDEAGQAIEPETLVPLTLGVTRLALVGDPQQLPGFICSQRAKQHGLGESLFSRLSSCAESWGKDGPILLDRQYRMHPHIADYPNRAFYDGLVHNMTLRALSLDVAPYFVLGIISGDNGQGASGANEAEAWGAARVALALRWRLRAAASATPAATDAHSLAVITPYTAQRDLVRRHLKTLLQAENNVEMGEVEVNTVDSFQGQERSVVVVSLARSHGLGFLSAAGRMNVMLTRAKHVLVLCLNPRALENNHQWRSLVEDAKERNLYGTLPIQMCRHPSVHQVPNQAILQYLSCNQPVNNTWNPPHHSFRRGSYKNNYRRRYNYVRN